MNTENHKSSKESRAKRLRIVRQMTGLTRQVFANKYDIPFSNFQNWEGPRYGGLTEQGALKVLRGCKMEGVKATLEWLMHGTEPGPTLVADSSDKKNSHPVLNNTIYNHGHEMELIEQELALFKQNYQQQVLDLVVEDDSMIPNYKVGDHVAGKYYKGKELLKLIGHDCIVKLSDGNLLLRQLKTGSSNQLFNLICNNPHAAIAKPVIYDAKVICAAPVIWLRRIYSYK